MLKQDLSMFENKEPQETVEFRKKNILAMAVALGVNEGQARENIEELFGMAEQVGELNYKKGIDSPDRGKIEQIGSWFLPETRTGNFTDGDRRKFGVGKRALELMREPLDSESFLDLRRTVECWGPKEDIKKFDEAMGGN